MHVQTVCTRPFLLLPLKRPGARLDVLHGCFGDQLERLRKFDISMTLTYVLGCVHEQKAPWQGVQLIDMANKTQGMTSVHLYAVNFLSSGTLSLPQRLRTRVRLIARAYQQA